MPTVPPMSAEARRRYAETTLHAVGAQPGETVTCVLAYPEDAELVAEMAKLAYERNIKMQIVSDPAIHQAIAHELGTDQAAMITITSENDSRVWQAAIREDHALLSVNEGYFGDEMWAGPLENNEMRWTKTYWPNPETAALAGYDGPLGVREWANDLLLLTRNTPEDPPGASIEHMNLLKQRAAELNALELDSVRIVNPDTATDLTIGLLPNSMFSACDWETMSGKRFQCNIPAEEVFFTPDPARADGTVQTVVPLVIFDGMPPAYLEFTMRNGQIQREGMTVIPADPQLREAALKNPTWLEDLVSDVYGVLASIPGALSIGEAALVASDSRPALLGATTGIDTVDENAGPHLGFGNSYRAGIEGFADDPRRNHSDLHLDMTLGWGSPEIRITGVDRYGHEHLLLDQGAWQILPTPEVAVAEAAGIAGPTLEAPRTLSGWNE